MPYLALLLIATVALALRLRFLLGGGGPLLSPTDYDDGVYFSAAALFTRGVLPYRDFVFVHPPGVVWFHALTGWWHDPAVAFAAARLLTAVVGGINTFLAGAIVLRSGSLFGGVVAAALYATYPDAVNAERSTYLEPLLNLACLSAAAVWLSPRPSSGRRSVAAGLLAGAACAVKLLGGVWVIAALASPPRDQAGRAIARFLGGGFAAGILLLAPFALMAPREMLEQLLWIQIARPPDGVMGVAARLPLLLGSGHLATTLLSFVAVLHILTRLARRGSHVLREERFFAVASVMTFLLFLNSASYWPHYNSWLAASQCVLAGLGAAAVTRIARGRRVAAVALATVSAVLLIEPVRGVLVAAKGRSAEQLALRREISSLDLPAGSLFSFDPSWGLVAGHIPPYGDGAPVIVDSYGAMLMTAMRGGEHSDADAAFRSEALQPAVAERIEAARYLLVGWRGEWQLPRELRARVAAGFLCITPAAGDLCVQARLPQPVDSIVVTEGEAPVWFESGWHDEEGGGAAAWRWSEGRASLLLPAREGRARLQLEIHVPLEQLGGAPELELWLDNELLDRFVADRANILRAYEVEGRKEGHVLTIGSSRTFSPAEDGVSQDTRSLGIRLTRLLWLSRDEWQRITGASRSLQR